MWLLLLGFLAGSIPFGLLVGKRMGVDIREKGSGNIGASNVTRVLGVGAGVVVAILDIAKGALPVWYARHHGGVPTMVGWAAILGHCFSPWLGGRGGKGVATAFGVFLIVSPFMAGVAIVVFGAVLAITRVPTIGSLAGMATIAALALHRGDPGITRLALMTLGLLVYTHRENLRELTTKR
jgi:acyl phosphate:glycerol-3-phosphate acyltransferase